MAMASRFRPSFTVSLAGFNPRLRSLLRDPSPDRIVQRDETGRADPLRAHSEE